MQDFNATLSAMAGSFDKTAEGRFTLVSACWKKVAGEMLSGRAIPAELSDGVLEVIVADQMWQRNLMSHSSELLFKLISSLGGRYVKQIRFEIRPKAFADRPEKAMPVDNTAVVSIADLPKSYLSAAGSIKSRSLREQFLSAAAASVSGNQKT